MVFIILYQRALKAIHIGEIVNGKMQLNQFGHIVRDEWLRTSHIRPNVHMDAFVVMPNHLHGVILIHDVEIPPEDDILPDLANHFGIRYWSATARRSAPNDQATHMDEIAHQIWRQPVNSLGNPPQTAFQSSYAGLRHPLPNKSISFVNAPAILFGNQIIMNTSFAIKTI